MNRWMGMDVRRISQGKAVWTEGLGVISLKMEWEFNRVRFHMSVSLVAREHPSSRAARGPPAQALDAAESNLVRREHSGVRAVAHQPSVILWLHRIAGLVLPSTSFSRENSSGYSPCSFQVAARRAEAFVPRHPLINVRTVSHVLSGR